MYVYRYKRPPFCKLTLGIFLYLHIYIHIYMCMYIHVYVYSIHIYLYVCIYKYVCTVDMYIDTWRYTYKHTNIRINTLTIKLLLQSAGTGWRRPITCLKL